MKKYTSVVRSTKKGLMITTQICKLRVILRSRVSRRGVYPREGYRSVTLMPMPGSTGLTRSALFCARKLYNPHGGGQNQTSVEFSMHEIINVNCWSGLLGSTGFVRKFLCTPCICGRPAEVQPRSDARVVSAVMP